MAISEWLSYLGAVTGVSGAVMGFIAFRRSGRFKALDMRLELRKAQSTIQADAKALAPLLEIAKKSHTRLASALGSYGSGATKHWVDEWDKDAAVLPALEAEAVAFQKDCSKLSHSALEDELIAAHILQRKIDTFLSKYRASLAEDDVQRVQLKEDQRMVTRTRLEQKT